MTTNEAPTGRESAQMPAGEPDRTSRALRRIEILEGSQFLLAILLAFAIRDRLGPSLKACLIALVCALAALAVTSRWIARRKRRALARRP